MWWFSAGIKKELAAVKRMVSVSASLANNSSIKQITLVYPINSFLFLFLQIADRHNREKDAFKKMFQWHFWYVLTIGGNMHDSAFTFLVMYCFKLNIFETCHISNLDHMYQFLIYHCRFILLWCFFLTFVYLFAVFSRGDNLTTQQLQYKFWSSSPLLQG